MTVIFRGVTIVAMLCLGACQAMHESPDFVRHSNSQLTEPDDVDVLYFDVYTNSQYPADNPAAESVRMSWLEGWFKQTGQCSNGYNIIERRKFEFLEQNSGRYDLRYEVQCKVVVPENISETPGS